MGLNWYDFMISWGICKIRVHPLQQFKCIMKFSVVDLEMFRGVCKQMCLKTSLLFLFNVQVVSSYLQPQRLQYPKASLSSNITGSLLKFMSIESVMPSNHVILCCLLLLLPSICPSIKVFSSEPALHIRWPEYWNFSSSNSPFNGYSGLVSFRIDWFDLLAIQGTLKSFLQQHSSKASILWCPAFFMVHPYMTTGKTIALIRWTLVGKVVSLLFNMLSRLVIAFFPRSKHHL